MIRPVDMSLIEIFARRESRTAIMDALYEAGGLEIEEFNRISAGGTLKVFSHESERVEAEQLLKKAQQCIKIMTSPRKVTDTNIPISSTLPEAEKILTNADAIISVGRTIDEEQTLYLSSLQREEFCSWLISFGIDPAQCRSSSRVSVRCGLIHNQAIEKIKTALPSAVMLFEKNSAMLKKTIMAFHSNETAHADEILTAADFAAINTDGAEPGIHLDTIAALKDQLSALAPDTTVFRHAEKYLMEYIRLSFEAEKAGLTGRCICMACWVPASDIAIIEKKIRSAAGSASIITAYTAEEISNARSIPFEKVPSLLKPSRLIDPFRLIVSIFAHPAYRHIDPSLIGGLGFLVMFGMMFADIGHGLIIAAAGIAAAALFRKGTMYNAGLLMLYAGAAAVCGGFVFGSVFGREDIIHPLWFSPMEHTDRFLTLGIALGGVMISSGIILNIIQMFWQRNIRGAVFSQWGILSLAFYWLSAGGIFYSLKYGSLPLSTPVVITVIALPVILLTAGDAFIELFHPTGEAAEIAFKPVDIVLGLLSNTVSFVRVAAFGLTHVALMAAVYIIASMNAQSSVFTVSTAIEGNIFVIALEGLIVTIQCLRLQYYEFYSKFFSVQGRPFLPLKKTGIYREAS